MSSKFRWVRKVFQCPFSIYFFIVLPSFFICHHLEAAPCCGRGAATPTLIVGEDKAQLGVGLVMGNVVAEPDGNGVPTPVLPDTRESNFNLRFDGAFLISDRFQLGASVSYVGTQLSNNHLSSFNQGIGDTRISLGYEILPEWTYSRWKPLGFLFLAITIPTGQSIYELALPGTTGITGNGFFGVSLGSLLIKKLSNWDAFLLPEIHYSLPRSFEFSNGLYEVVPGSGGSLALGLGWSPPSNPFRIGIRVQPRVDLAKQIPALQQSGEKSAYLMQTDLAFDISYLLMGEKYYYDILFGPDYPWSNAELEPESKCRNELSVPMGKIN